MKRPLRQLLQIRELVEDLALAEFEDRAARMRALEMAAVRQEQEKRSLRARLVQDLMQPQAATPADWQLHRADSELASHREERLRALAEAERPEVDRARTDLLERRLERRQVETLHAAAVEAEEKRRVRLDQNRTDDWFQSQSGERNQRKK